MTGEDAGEDETTGVDKSSIRVSFRNDVVFSDHDNAAKGVDNVSSTRSSTRSKTSDTSSGGDSAGTDGSTPSSSSSNKYAKLRSSLTREQRNRDPLYFYRVTKILGQGSMGDVKLVQKRKVGGSARRDIQAAVKRQQREKECLQIPVVGHLFQLCMDGNLKDREGDNAVVVVPSSADSSHHSFASLFGGGGKDTSTHSSTITARTFEDSLFGDSSRHNNNHLTPIKPPNQIITYAMKSILLSQVYRQEFIDELRNEIAILKDLDHPHIVKAIETFEFRGRISIVMEVCSGGDLYARDPYSEAEAARIVSQILSAISYMHSKNVVHRDLKFENVLFVNTSPMSEVKLIDFGLSRVYMEGDQELSDISGTIYTMAPEVLLGNHTEKADLWSIGVITFMLLSSALPFFGKQRKRVTQKILTNKYSFKGKRWHVVSDEGKKFIKDLLLVFDPNERADAETALKSAWLQLHLAGQSTVSGEATSMTRRVVTSQEEALAKASIWRYANYPKLKKMALMVVAHKSSSEEIGILRQLFKKYDTRHDGSIWFEEFVDAVNNLGHHSGEELRLVFDAMDLSGSGKIRYTEFIAATIEAHGAISEARLAEAFDRLDCDDSGFITADNLMEILGADVPKEEIDAIIAQADLVKDHCVSYSEFLAMWEDVDKPVEVNNNIPNATGDTDENRKVVQLATELSSITDDGTAEDAEDAHAEFLKEKHLQNTLHTWAAEMQLPAQEFALGCTFLHQAAIGGLADLETMLEDRPGLVNFRDYDRRTALHIAASEGHVEVCKFLVQKGARVNRSDRWGGFPLDDAHRHKRLEVVNLLRQHGAKFGSTSQTVNLITAASEGNLSEVRTLLEFGSMDLNQGDYDHRTALHLAANEGHVEVVKLLCKAGADVNVKDRWGDRPIDDAKKAKKNGAAISAILSGGRAFAEAFKYHHQAARMHELKDQSSKEFPVLARQQQPDEEGMMTQLPVHEFAMGCSILHQAALGNQLVLQNILLERPLLVNFRDYDRRTALHIAASEGQLEICQFLVARGARINRVDRWGGSPLDDAHRHRHVEVVKFLRHQGAKFGSTSQATNFITAASEGDVEEVQAFLDFGTIDLDQGDYDLRTALHLAAGEGRFEIVEMLCEAGANVNVEDRWGHCPLDDAKSAKSNSTEIIKLLLQYGATSNSLSTKITATLLSLFAERR